MVSLEDLHKLPPILNRPQYRLAFLIAAGRHSGHVHNAAIWRTLREAGLIDNKKQLTLIGRAALDKL